MAYVWYNLAAPQGHPEAGDSRDESATRLDPASFAEGQRLSDEYFKFLR